MKSFIVALFTLLTASCGTLAPAQVGDAEGMSTFEMGDGSVGIIMSPAMVTKCKAQGGCATLSQDYLEALIKLRCAKMEARQ